MVPFFYPVGKIAFVRKPIKTKKPLKQRQKKPGKSLKNNYLVV